MKMQLPRRKEQIRKVLEVEGKALSIDELERLTQIPKEKIRQVLTTFEHQIVRVGPKTFDLANRVYPGKIFRYTPERIEIEQGILKAEEDIHLFLTAAINFQSTITLIDHQNKQYHLSRIVTSQKYPFSYYRGIPNWYKRVGFEIGDDIILKCKDLGTHTFHIDRQKKKDRDKLAITVRNRELANLVYTILSYAPNKYEMDLFLVRKYLYVYNFHHAIPPDHLQKALSSDKRFLFSNKHTMHSWTGYPLNHELVIGLRKFFHYHEDYVYAPVFIDRDEYGRFGFCLGCEERVIWEDENGWRNVKNDAEYVDSYLPAIFFKIEKEYKVIH